jgi:hypothetical protein
MPQFRNHPRTKRHADFYEQALQGLVKELFTVNPLGNGQLGGRATAPASNRQEMPQQPAQILPISAAVERHMTPQAGRRRSEQFLERKMTAQRATTEQRRERAELDPRFGKIGLSAVAAAMRYQSEPKNSNYAPATIRPLDHDDEAAA